MLDMDRGEGMVWSVLLTIRFYFLLTSRMVNICMESSFYLVSLVEVNQAILSWDEALTKAGDALSELC